MSNWKSIFLTLALLTVSVACNMAGGDTADLRITGGAAAITTGGAAAVTTGGAAATGGTTTEPVQVTCINNAGNKVGVGIVQNCSCATNKTGTQSCQSDGTWSSCGSCVNTGICTAGSTANCACPNGASGTKTCKADGSSYDACVCETHTCTNNSGTTVGVGATQDCTCGASMTGGTQSCQSDGSWSGCNGCVSNGTGGATSVQVTCMGTNNTKVSVGSTQTCSCGAGSNGVQTCLSSGSWSNCGSCSNPPGTGGSTSVQTSCLNANGNHVGVGTTQGCTCGGGMVNGVQTCLSDSSWSTCTTCTNPAGTGGSTSVIITTCTTASGTAVSIGSTQTCSCGAGSNGVQVCQSNGAWGNCNSCTNPNNGTGGSTSVGGGTADVKFSCTPPYSPIVITSVFAGMWDGQPWTNLCDMNMGQVEINGDTLSCSFKVARGRNVMINQQTNYKVTDHLADGSILVTLKNGSSGVLPSGAADQWSAFEATGTQAENLHPSHGVYNETFTDGSSTLRCNTRSECFLMFGTCTVTINGSSTPLGVGNIVKNDGDIGGNFVFYVP